MSITNLKDFRKELESLENDDVNPSADVWYYEIIRGKSIFPGQPDHIMIWWWLNEDDPEQKTIKEKASILNVSSFIDTEEKQILLYDDRNDYDELYDFLEGEWLILSYEEFMEWIDDYEKFFDQKVKFEYQGLTVNREDNETDIDINLFDLEDAIIDIIYSYEEQICEMITNNDNDNRWINSELHLLEQTAEDEIEDYIDKHYNIDILVNIGFEHKRWPYPGELRASCLISY